jgi:DNA-binding LacI/PurR family transcriptional regulator
MIIQYNNSQYYFIRKSGGKMSLYILVEKSSSYFFETRRKQEIASIKSLNQKRIPTIVFEDIEEIPEIFTDSKAVLLVAHGLNENNEHCVKICNENGIPVILLHDKSKKHYKYIYNSIADNDDITASTIYRYFKANGKEKIAFFGFYANSEHDVSKTDAFYKVNLNFSHQDVFHIKSGFNECMNDFWEHRYEYDGVYFPNDFIAIAFLNYFRNNEPAYFEDRFFLGVSDTIMARLFHISLSSVTYSSPFILAISRDFCNTSFDSRLKYGSPPETLGRDAISRSIKEDNWCVLAPTF